MRLSLLSLSHEDLLKLALEYCCKFVVIPFEWDKSKNKIQASNSKWKKGIGIVFAIISFVHFYYYFNKIQNAYFNKNYDRFSFNFIMCTITPHNLVTKIGFWMYSREILSVLNQCIELNQKLMASEGFIYLPGKNMSFLVILSIVGGCIEEILLASWQFYGDKDYDPNFGITGFTGSIVTTTFFLIFIIMAYYEVLVSLTFLYAASALILSTLHLWTKRSSLLEIGPKYWVNEHDGKRKLLDKAINLYKQMQILNHLNNSSFGELFYAYVQVFFIIVGTTLAHGSIRAEFKISILSLYFVIFTFFCYILLFLVLKYLSLLYKNSCQVNRIYSSAIEKEYCEKNFYRRIIKSLCPVSCSIGSAYLIESRAILTTADSTLQLLANALLFF